MTEAVQYTGVVQENSESFVFNKFYFTPPHSTFLRVWKDEVRTAAAVIVNWIKFKKKKKKKVYSKELKK